MKKLILASSLALCALGGTAVAADLIVEEPAVVAPASGYDWYAQFLGGVVLPGDYDYEGTVYDIPAAWAVAGVVGVGLGVEGLSAELDLFLSKTAYDDDDFELTTGSAMAALKYTVALNDSFGIYGAVGLGGVYLKDEDADGSSVYVDGWGAGYLLKAGVTAQVAEQISLVGEARYANSFDEIDDAGQHGAAALLVGIQIGF